MPIDPTKGLYIRWSKREKDLMYYFPRPPDGCLVNTIFSGDRPFRNLKKNGEIEYGKSFLKELEDRGYDITTLKFSILKKNNEK